jgi:hypothetical protein
VVSSPAGRMARALALTACLLASASAVPGRTWSSEDSQAGRLVPGKGTFPRWRSLAVATDIPLRLLVALPPHGLAALDGEGTLWVFDVARTALSVIGRYGSVAGIDASIMTVRLGQDRAGIVTVSPEGRLLVWSDGVLRAYDVGSPLSRRAVPVPIAMPGRPSQDLLAVAEDGAVVLIGGLAAGGPRVVARLDVHALADGRIGLLDLDGDGTPEAVILTDPVPRRSGGGPPDNLDAVSVTVIGLRPNGLELRARFEAPGPAVFAALLPAGAPVLAGSRLAPLLVRNVPGQGAAVIALAWRDEGLALLAEGPALAQGQGPMDVIGAADLSGDGVAEIVAACAGVVTAYRRVGASLLRVAQAPGYAPRGVSFRSAPEPLLADLDGDGRPEIVVTRRARDALMGLRLDAGRLVAQWLLEFRTPLGSSPVIADLDGDGLLDLAVADRRALNLFLSIR